MIFFNQSQSESFWILGIGYDNGICRYFGVGGVPSDSIGPSGSSQPQFNPFLTFLCTGKPNINLIWYQAPLPFRVFRIGHKKISDVRRVGHKKISDVLRVGHKKN